MAERPLEGHVAIVTGGAGGIGRAYARGLLNAGARVVICDIDGASAEATATQLDENGGSAIGVPCDIAEASDGLAVVQTAIDRFGGLDILVNNAAMMAEIPTIDVLDQDPAVWSRAFDVNVKGAWLMTRAAVPAMRTRGGGRIINQVSGGAFKPAGLYGATKLALWREWRFVARDDRREPFASLAFSPLVAANISLFSGRGVGIRYWNDILSRKAPATDRQTNSATGWHQDFPNHPMDRVGGATVWIALDDVTADQGAMQFISGSHREGPLGRTYSSGTTTGGEDLLDQYPWLTDRYDVSAPVELQAGDATFHHPLVVHGAGANLTPRNRWSFIVMYAPADAIYTGASYPATDDLDLTVGQPFDHPVFPLLFTGKGAT